MMASSQLCYQVFGLSAPVYFPCALVIYFAMAFFAIVFNHLFLLHQIAIVNFFLMGPIWLPKISFIFFNENLILPKFHLLVSGTRIWTHDLFSQTTRSWLITMYVKVMSNYMFSSQFVWVYFFPIYFKYLFFHLNLLLQR